MYFTPIDRHWGLENLQSVIEDGLFVVTFGKVSSSKDTISCG